MTTLVPKDGHCLLLMEPNPGVRTFSDYQNVDSCLDSLLKTYEAIPDHVPDYTLNIIYGWLDQFERITLYIFNAEVARYKRLTHTQFKELFRAAIQRAQQRANEPAEPIQSIEINNNNQLQDSPPTDNGPIYRNISRSHRFRDREDDLEEDWE